MSSSRGAQPAGVQTEPAHPDERLRGRTYGVRFEDVWQAALALAGGRQRGWRLLTADDEKGVIHAVATRRFPQAEDAIVIRITLDDNAQTRVDAAAAARDGRPAVRRNAGRLRRFFRALDTEVARAAARQQHQQHS